MKIRPLANVINILDMKTNQVIGKMYFDANYDEALKQARNRNTLLQRFPERYTAF